MPMLPMCLMLCMDKRWPVYCCTEPASLRVAVRQRKQVSRSLSGVQGQIKLALTFTPGADEQARLHCGRKRDGGKTSRTSIAGEWRAATKGRAK